MNGTTDSALMSDMDLGAMVGDLCLSINTQYAVAEEKIETQQLTILHYILLYTM
jgi:hypothetical protein